MSRTDAGIVNVRLSRLALVVRMLMPVVMCNEVSFKMLPIREKV